MGTFTLFPRECFLGAFPYLENIYELDEIEQGCGSSPLIFEYYLWDLSHDFLEYDMSWMGKDVGAIHLVLIFHISILG